MFMIGLDYFIICRASNKSAFLLAASRTTDEMRKINVQRLYSASQLIKAQYLDVPAFIGFNSNGGISEDKINNHNYL